MNSKNRRRLAWLAVPLVAAGLVACSDQAADRPHSSATVIVPGRPGEEASTIAPGDATPVEEEPPNDADFTFVQDMVVHHAQALTMTDLVPDRAQNEQVKGLADRIADSQRVEIDMLNRWLKEHNRPAVDPDSHDHSGDHADMPGYATPAQLRTLEGASGSEFDTVFLQLMISHHEGALAMVETVRTAGHSVRVQEIADDVAVSQSDEINRMRGMLPS